MTIPPDALAHIEHTSRAAAERTSAAARRVAHEQRQNAERASTLLLLGR